MTFEYGTTVEEEGKTLLSPACRIGNLTRIIDRSDLLGPAGNDALELSFPALRGASGAPVLTTDGGYKVVGVIVANVAYDALPVQVHTVLDEKNELLEEIRYILPQGIAVNIRHLREMYERIVG